ncbi:hypothetical protein [Neisseria sp. Ec49-e6-T10]|uniref:hypothetical protein n=1 Tax=Neisseria sp. Ec49-e6-T10 TaxID=3140744 RepID=UPI003EC0C12F
MHTFQLINPLEKDGIAFVDIVEPVGFSIDFAKACAALSGQFLYSQGKYTSSTIGQAFLAANEEAIKGAAEAKKEAEKEEQPEIEDVFETAKSMNVLYSQADPDFLVNIIQKFADLYKKNPKVLQVNGEAMKQLHFNSLSFKDLSILATAYCVAFMLG